jgi:hypothetical protein
MVALITMRERLALLAYVINSRQSFITPVKFGGGLANIADYSVADFRLKFITLNLFVVCKNRGNRAQSPLISAHTLIFYTYHQNYSFY